MKISAPLGTGVFVRLETLHILVKRLCCQFERWPPPTHHMKTILLYTARLAGPPEEAGTLTTANQHNSTLAFAAATTYFRNYPF